VNRWETSQREHMFSMHENECQGLHEGRLSYVSGIGVGHVGRLSY
jgi:hypothetical protein